MLKISRLALLWLRFIKLHAQNLLCKINKQRFFLIFLKFFREIFF